MTAEINTPKIPVTASKIRFVLETCKYKLPKRLFEVITFIVRDKWPTNADIRNATEDDLIRCAILFRTTGADMGWRIDAWHSVVEPHAMDEATFKKFANAASEICGDKTRIGPVFHSMAGHSGGASLDEVAFVESFMKRAGYEWAPDEEKWIDVRQ